MNKILLAIFLIIALIAGSFAKPVHGSKVPQAVKTSFSHDYPEARVIRWETTEKADFKVEYKIGETYGAAFYDAAGHFIEGDKIIEWKEVPLTGRLEVYHSGADKILNALKIVTADNKVFYQIDLRKDKKKVEVLLDEEGNIIR